LENTLNVVLTSAESGIEGIALAIGDETGGTLTELTAETNNLMSSLIAAVAAIDPANQIDPPATASGQAALIGAMSNVEGAIADFNLANGNKFDALLIAIADLAVDTVVTGQAIEAAIDEFQAANTGENALLLAALNLLIVCCEEGHALLGGGGSGGGDSDDDVPKLEEIRALIEETSATDADHVALDYVATLETATDQLDTDLEDMEEAGVMDLGTGFDRFDGTAVAPSLYVSVPRLQGGSRVDDSVNMLDLGNFSTAGVVSLDTMFAWIKAVIVAAAMFYYITSLFGLLSHYAELDAKSVPTQPVTNYGGATGGVVNLPVKLAQVAVGLGMTAAAIGLIATAFNWEGGFVQEALAGYLSIVYGDQGTMFEAMTWLPMACDFVDMLLPVPLLITLFVSYWTLKYALVLNVWIITKTQRVLS